MELIRQRLSSDCAVCTVAMLSDTPYEQILADNPDFERQTDEAWLAYLKSLGFQIRRSSIFTAGHRYFCVATVAEDRDPMNSHAIAVDENLRVFDPSPNAPKPGELPLQWYTSAPQQLSFRHCVGPSITRRLDRV